MKVDKKQFIVLKLIFSYLLDIFFLLLKPITNRRWVHLCYEITIWNSKTIEKTILLIYNIYSCVPFKKSVSSCEDWASFLYTTFNKEKNSSSSRQSSNKSRHFQIPIDSSWSLSSTPRLSRIALSAFNWCFSVFSPTLYNIFLENKYISVNIFQVNDFCSFNLAKNINLCKGIELNMTFHKCHVLLSYDFVKNCQIWLYQTDRKTLNINMNFPYTMNGLCFTSNYCRKIIHY